MPAYVVVEVDVRDPALYEDYKRLAPPAIAAYGGRYLARGGRTDALEGDPGPGRLVILEFPSLERAREWWESDAYATARSVRQSCASARMIAVEGLSSTPRRGRATRPGPPPGS
jgi:uncharacterized protein (DUF1330 family)